MSQNDSIRDIPLPSLRQDLQIFPGPDDSDGSPTFNILDPVSGNYTKVGWGETLVFKNLTPGMTLNKLLNILKIQTTLRVTKEEVLNLCHQAKICKLLDTKMSSEELSKEAETQKSTWTTWLLHHYLYFRIPFLKPDKFLEKTVFLVKPLVSATAFKIYSVILALGILLLMSRLDSYFSTFLYFFNPRGMLIYGMAIIAIKVIHEFSHAYVAKIHGVRVPAMGIAFIVFWPVPFCDVTDAWRLKSRKKRFSIGFAGVGSEMVLAALSLCAWYFSPPGILQSLFFVVSSVTLLSTFLANLNPAMRFDGYYLLADAWGVDNLQQRAFAMTRWFYRKVFLGFRNAPPEEMVSKKQLCGFVIYSLYTWIYRVILYLGIALLVYYKFAKILGLFLFSVEILFFIIKPLINEGKVLWKMKHLLSLNFKLIFTSTVMTAILIWLIFPMSRTINIPAITVPLKSQIIYAPTSGTIQTLNVKRGDQVYKGQNILSLHERYLEAHIKVLGIKITMLNNEIRRYSGVENEKRFLLPELKEDLGRFEAQLNELNEIRNKSLLTSDIDGRILQLKEGLRVGLPIEKDAVLGYIAMQKKLKVQAFVSEKHIDEFKIGDVVNFKKSSDTENSQGKVTFVGAVKLEKIEHKALTSTMQGDIAVVPGQDENLVPIESIYLVEIELDEEIGSAKFGETGSLQIKTRPQSLAMNFILSAWATVVKESNF